MKFNLFLLVLSLILSGCASKMAYLNTQKPAEEVQKDKTECQASVEASDFKDASLKQKKFNQCMQGKGYNVVSEEEAEKIQGFIGLWVKPGVDLKPYEAVYIEKVDLSQVKVNNPGALDKKVADSDINNLGEEMHKRFSNAVMVVMPVITDKEEASGKRVFYISLKLKNISQTGVGLSAVLQVAGNFSPVPLPDAPEGVFSFEGIIFDPEKKEKLITISDEVTADKNSSLVGVEKFSHWQKAYNIMDYWADHLAELLAKERNQEYKSHLGIKIF
ncbi:MAG: DUF3313 family protein [Candidatus Omnitrophica bacterium]|nr:DUF3313 family protein [Candidatus Omnitrophota bacterium]